MAARTTGFQPGSFPAANRVERATSPPSGSREDLRSPVSGRPVERKRK